MRGRNYYVYDADPARLQTLKDEYESMGRATKIEDGRLIVFALQPRPVKKEKRDDRSGRPGRTDRTKSEVR